jgi:hypothetical protein
MNTKGKIINGFYCGFQVVDRKPFPEELQQAHITGTPPHLIETDSMVVPMVMNLTNAGSPILSANPSCFAGFYDERAVSIQAQSFGELIIEDFRSFLDLFLGIDHEQAFPGFEWEKMYFRLNQRPDEQ